MNLAEAKDVLTKSKSVLKLLKQKYPTLDAYLVFSSCKGQSLPDESFWQTLLNFPHFFISTTQSKQAIAVAQKKKHLTDNKKATLEEDAELEKIEPLLCINEDVQIEIRFGQLDYELIAKLQKDELVDQKLTPQGKSSIRIVIGKVRKVVTD